jgi:hypothetical protein
MITDRDVGAGVTIDIFHHKIHTAQFYTGADTCTIGANTTMYYMLRTPASTLEDKSHARFAISATGNVQAALFESPTATTNTGETSITFRNNDRSSASTTRVTFSRALTANVSPGTAILDVGGASGSAPGMIPSLIGGEWILDNSKTYALMVLNANAALTTNVYVSCYFYQENVR